MFTIGLDLGKERDYSALTLVQNQMQRLAAVKLHRWPLGTSYVNVARDVATLTRKEQIAGKAVLVVDATGLGGPFMDVLREERPGCGVVALTIGGRGRLRPTSPGFWKVGVPKGVLVQTLAAAVEGKRFTVARTEPLAGVLLQEMQRLEVRIDAKGHAVYAADFAAGTNDDLLLATMYAVWMALKGVPT